jgi:hypothetical protein
MDSLFSSWLPPGIDDWSPTDIGEPHQVDVSELRGLDAGKSFLRFGCGFFNFFTDSVCRPPPFTQMTGHMFLTQH